MRAPLGYKLDIFTLKVSLDPIRPLAPPGGVLRKNNPEIGFLGVDYLWDSSWSQCFVNFNYLENFNSSGIYPENWASYDLEWPWLGFQDI